MLKNNAILLFFLLFFNGLLLAEEIKLTPQIRSEPHTSIRYLLPREQIESHLRNVLIMKEDEFVNLPSVVEAPLSSAGQRILVENVPEDRQAIYTLLKKYKVYRDPDTEEELGYLILVVGKARLEKFDTLSTFEILETREEIENGIRLIPQAEISLPSSLEVKIPNNPVEGGIVAFVGTTSDAGLHDVVVINLGERDGLEQGSLLNVVRYEHPFHNSFTTTHDPDFVPVPRVVVGTLVVYKPMEQASLGLLTEVNGTIIPTDRIESL